MKQFVYFIECGDGGPIKIGVATDVAERLRDLQTANPFRLRLLVSIPGGHELERELHRRFGNERMHGEWFRGDGDARAFAASLVTDATTALDRLTAERAARIRARRRQLPQRQRRYSPAEWLEMTTTGLADGVTPEEARDAIAARWRRAGGSWPMTNDELIRLAPGLLLRFTPGDLALVEKELGR